MVLSIPLAIWKTFYFYVQVKKQISRRIFASDFKIKNKKVSNKLNNIVTNFACVSWFLSFVFSLTCYSTKIEVLLPWHCWRFSRFFGICVRAISLFMCIVEVAVACPCHLATFDSEFRNGVIKSGLYLGSLFSPLLFLAKFGQNVQKNYFMRTNWH